MKLTAKVKPMPKEPKSYGHITLSSADFPGVADLKLGDKQTFTVEVDITALRKPDRWEVSDGNAKPNDVVASIKIMNVVLPKEKKTS
jgi:hypothetical protein